MYNSESRSWPMAIICHHEGRTVRWASDTTLTHCSLGARPLPPNSLVFALEVLVDFHRNLFEIRSISTVASTHQPRYSPKPLPRWQRNKTHITCQASKSGLNLISQHCRSIGHIHATSRSLSICYSSRRCTEDAMFLASGS